MMALVGQRKPGSVSGQAQGRANRFGEVHGRVHSVHSRVRVFAKFPHCWTVYFAFCSRVRKPQSTYVHQGFQYYDALLYDAYLQWVPLFAHQRMGESSNLAGDRP